MTFVLIILRIIFIGLLTYIGYDLAAIFINSPIGHQYSGPILGFSIGVIIIAVEVRLRPIFRKTTFAIITGLIIGLTISYILIQIIGASFLLSSVEPKWFETIKLLITFTLTYLSISTVIQTKDKFRFIIPYFEFRGQKIGSKITILDISVLMDSRLIGFLKANLFETQIGLPKLAYFELKKMTESSDKQKKIRGFAGLANYQEIKNFNHVAVQEMEDDHLPGDPGIQIVRIAEMYQGKILTADIAIITECHNRNIEALNINEIAKAFYPPYLPGECIEVEILKVGDNKQQGIGYLPDATMVVVENGKDYLGKKVKAEITQYLQRSSGNMYFAKFVNTL